MLAGRKTYIVSAAMVAYAALGFLLGELDANRAVELILEASAVAALRRGVG